jgi:hypothetical protein
MFSRSGITVARSLCSLRARVAPAGSRAISAPRPSRQTNPYHRGPGTFPNRNVGGDATQGWCLRTQDLRWSFVKRAGRGGLLVLVLCSLSLMGAEASAAPPSRSAARHRHRAHPRASHPVSQRRGSKGAKRSHPRTNRRRPERAAPAQTEPEQRSALASVTLTTAAEGTSFYVDNRRVGSGSTVHHSLPPGYHQLQAVHPSGARWQKYLSFEAGDERKLIIFW